MLLDWWLSTKLAGSPATSSSEEDMTSYSIIPRTSRAASLSRSLVSRAWSNNIGTYITLPTRDNIANYTKQAQIHAAFQFFLILVKFFVVLIFLYFFFMYSSIFLTIFLLYFVKCVNAFFFFDVGFFFFFFIKTFIFLQ